jgi:hypothetical protein
VTKTTAGTSRPRWRMPTAFLAVLGAALAACALAGPAAMASVLPYAPEPDGPKGLEVFPGQIVIMTGGTPAREVALIAVGAAVAAAVLTVLAYRFWLSQPWTRRPLSSMACADGIETEIDGIGAAVSPALADPGDIVTHP